MTNSKHIALALVSCVVLVLGLAASVTAVTGGNGLSSADRAVSAKP